MRTLAALLVVAGIGPLRAQATLTELARGAREAWLAHDTQSLVGQGASLVLQIPGAHPSVALGAGQAAELLRRYLRGAVERAVHIRRVTEGPGESGLVEMERDYTVGGTEDVRRETIFLRYHRAAARWQLTELRAAP